ncbi:tripartite tricarboxylate transporter substrate binding protein [Bradyrhizobium sp. LHD-71]|uniref:Bug family tripartite tricarboxylate transporter substrate binding protein n=1 Tax=Bradyrhizobium sp. LHD-71 TaxID=3072141 RepID=UPI002810459D|nr:tripartite tricarboxylate transporter substrate binding protein [Bradyrhizobium sp. LHD-71]MDQ8728733.1 tripartite tricarboxylate transporter substrate binding protein [Bradyrhizobium sp. LHD-71]
MFCLLTDAPLFALLSPCDRRACEQPLTDHRSKSNAGVETASGGIVMIRLWSCVRAALCLLASLFVSCPTVAQDYPSRPIILVVPFPAGGSTDIVARITSQELSKRIGVPVVVENRPGGGTIVGSLSVKSAKPDGYTLLLSTNTFYASALSQKNPGYDPFRDFVTLVPLASAAYVLIAPRDVRTLDDLIERSKAQPGQSNYGSLGTGASQMVLAEQLKEAIGIDWQEVPYKGAADAILAIMRGDVQGFFGTDGLAAQYVKNPDVNLLATSGAKRSSYIPGVPTFAELGHPEIYDLGLFAVAARSETPDQIVQVLRQHLASVARAPELLQVLKSNSLEPYEGTLVEYDTLAQDRYARSATILRKLGFTAK